MWSDAPESTIQSVVLPLHADKAFKWLPVCAKEELPLELSIFVLY